MRMIARGKWAKVYDLGEKVLIKSDDPIKECVALFCEGDRLPELTKVDYGVYECPKYTIGRGIVGKLSPEDQRDYRTLRKLASGLRLRLRRYDCFQQLQQAIDQAQLQADIRASLESVLYNAANYTDFIGFEISPRNIAIDKSGKLILLDLFFDRNLP